MISAAAQTTPRARLALGRAASTSLPHQHTRHFRYGPWQVESDDACGYHRSVRYRYMDTLSRRLAWDTHCARTASQTAIPPLASGLANSATYADTSNVESWSDDLTGVGATKTAAAVEREAVEQMLRPQQDTSQIIDELRRPLMSVRDYVQELAPKCTPQTVDAETMIQATSQSPNHSKIDVCKSSTVKEPNTPWEITAEEKSKHYDDLKKYRPTEWNEPDGLPSRTPEEKSKDYADLKKYGSVKWKEPDGLPGRTAEEKSKDYDDVKKYGSVKWNEPDGLPGRTPEEKSKDYDDLDKYKPAKWNEPDGLPGRTPEEKSKDYDDLDKYKPAKWNEPDGLPGRTPEEKSKDYDDLHKYGPVKWHEPDGLPDLTAEEKTKFYTDLDKYGPAKFSEPDGLCPLTPEELSKNYNDLDDYAQGFQCKDALLDAQHRREMDGTQRGNLRPAKVDAEPANYAQEYKDLDKYGPVTWNEPDGLQPLTPEERSKNYQDLHKYAQYPNSGPKTERIHPEEASKRYDDLSKYEEFPNGDPDVARIHPEEASKQYSDLSAYPRAGFEEPDVKERVHPEELTKKYADLSAYNPCAFDAVDKKYPMHPEDKTKNYKDLDNYKSFYDEKVSCSSKKPTSDEFNKHDREIVQRTAAYQASIEELKTSENDDTTGAIKDAAQRRFINLEDTKKKYKSSFEVDSPQTRQPISSEKRLDVEREAMRRAEKLEDGKAEYAAQWGGEEHNQTPVAQQLESMAEQRLQNLEGAKSEYESSWDTAIQNAQSRVSRRQAGLESEKDDGVSSMDESFPADKFSVQDTLSKLSARQKRTRMSEAERSQAERDPYSRAPQGLEVSYSQEIGDESTWPTLVKHYRWDANHDADVSPSKQTVAAGSGDGANGSSTTNDYVVLAFDAETQKVHVAQTRSAVGGDMSAMTPWEALVGLSRPAKFFAHLKPLQAQGYEIVSGRGDVLVFCRVRQAEPGARAYDASRVGRRRRWFGQRLIVGVVSAGGFAYCAGTLAEYLSTNGYV